jgi:hypothetical protein
VSDTPILLFRELHGRAKDEAAQKLVRRSHAPELTWSDGSEVRIFAVDDPSDEPGRCPAVLAAASTVPGSVTLRLHAVDLSDQWRCPLTWERLIGGLADRCRAEGLRRIVARPVDLTVVRLLENCGFRAVKEGWSDLQSGDEGTARHQVFALVV